MEEKPIIEIKNIGKKYSISHHKGGYIALRDVLTNIIKNPFGFAKAKAKGVLGIDTKEEFWALKDVNFSVNKGEVVGIIGHNGAGKSTLLKILTGITPPTTGEIKMRGRVASLLEVGTGFHPELSGRENIFLNGAILGMTKKEISNKFDDIVAFSGVEKFIDTPVKYYSSGMYVRLAFSVAAHMEPDILLVDEVLAVGDAEFQKKCLGKMEEVTKNSGRTILFVSHNLTAIENLCERSILLKNGRVVAVGPTKEIIEKYSDESEKTLQLPLIERIDRKGTGRVTFSDCKTVSVKNEKDNSVTIKLTYINKTGQKINDVKISTDIFDSNDLHLANITNNVLEQKIDLNENNGEIYLTINNINLTTGKYYFDFFLANDSINSEIFDWIRKATFIEVNNNGFYSTKKMPPVKSTVLLNFSYNQ